MDVLVMLEEHPGPPNVLAHVNSVPGGGAERSRDVVTLYGDASPESLALALAAAVESRRAGGQDADDAIRHVGVWSEHGAIGDAAWRDVATGQLVTRDLDIPLVTLLSTAQALLGECGQAIRRLLAGLLMPDWPEGTRRALHISLHPVFALAGSIDARADALLAAQREAAGVTFDDDGD